MSEKSTGAFVGGVIIGAAVGAIAGLLAAPKKGQDTRKLIKESADALPDLMDDVSTSVQFHVERLAESSLSKWDRSLLRLRNAITTGLDASKQESQRLSQSMNRPSLSSNADDPS